MFVEGSDLFQSIHRLVVGHGSGSAILVEGDDTLGFTFHLLVLSLGSIQLDLVICRVEFSQELSGFDWLPVLHMNLSDSATHPKSQADIFCRLNLSRVL